MKLNLSAVAVTAASMFAFGQSALADPVQDVEVYAGYAFGDDLVDKPASGHAIKLDDNAKIGTRYTFFPTQRFGLQLAAGASPTKVKYAQGGDVDVDVYTVDANLLVDLIPGLNVAGHKVSTYAVIGGGYAWADANDPIVGVVGSATRTLEDDGGFTANAGIGAKLFVTNALYVGLDARYRYFDKLLKTDGNELNTVETTVSVGFRF